LGVSEAKGKHLSEVLPEVAVSKELCVGQKKTVRSVPVIVNQVPIIENGEQIGCSFAFLDISDIEKIVAEVEIVKKMQTKIDYYRDELEKRDSNNRFDQILTKDPRFLSIKRDAGLIARSSSTVLLTGESGVGKDIFAKGIHSASPRAKRPFVKVSCVSIPETLFESELFGYAPGSFTGALKNGKPGYFEMADTGTIFLDEIGDMPMSVQAKLLQVIQEKEFMRVGGTKKQTVDVRIIAATNRNLREDVAKKTFREDLYYRLDVIEFHLPPLRERRDDIALLANSFVEKYNRILGSKVTGISRQALDVMQNYPWPGNIRELENAIERAANYVWEGEIDACNLPAQVVREAGSARLQAQAAPVQAAPVQTQEAATYQSSIENLQKEALLDALRRAGGNKSEAARLMNLSRSAFYDRLKKHCLR
ncbi:MAG: sigma 54-interacting transcriptional regulator, partial [Clostridiales bacterium]|nr:sigma 54-interacting transcriptional regulator [Clostridiales bacterium]